MVGVTCEKCGATYRFDDADVPPSGKIIKCARCQSAVTVMPAGAAAMGMRTPPSAGVVPAPGPAKKPPGLVPPPLSSAAALDDYCSPQERAGVDSALSCAVVGAPDTVRAGMQAFVAKHQPDELMLTANIFDHAARLKSFALAITGA